MDWCKYDPADPVMGIVTIVLSLFMNRAHLVYYQLHWGQTFGEISPASRLQVQGCLLNPEGIPPDNFPIFDRDDL
jgi:hypothetical protein